jgi:hypothetical protein
MAQGKTSVFFNRVDEVANAAIAKADATKKNVPIEKVLQERENRRLGPGIDRSRGGPRLEPPTFPDFPAVEPGTNAGRRMFSPTGRNPLIGGSERARGGSKEPLTKLYA